MVVLVGEVAGDVGPKSSDKLVAVNGKDAHAVEAARFHQRIADMPENHVQILIGRDGGGQLHNASLLLDDAIELSKNLFILRSSTLWVHRCTPAFSAFHQFLGPQPAKRAKLLRISV